jgi:aflatoxin B1 aldehyde reductase
VIFNPLAGGILTSVPPKIVYWFKFRTYLANQYPQQWQVQIQRSPTEGRYSNTNTNQGNIYRDRYFRDATFDSLQLIEPEIQKHNLTLLETALRWCVHHSALKVMDGNDGVIIGVSSLKQLEGNLRDLEKGPLPEDVVQALDQA